MDISSLICFLEQQQIPFQQQEPMSRHTSIRIGGPAQVFCRPTAPEQAAAIRGYCHSHAIPCFVVGNGSDLLVSDRGISGVVLCTTGLSGIELLPENRIRCFAGVQLWELCRAALNASLTGLEFAYGIPATVGGAVFMNAGAYGGETKDVLESVTCLTREGELLKLTAEQAELSYRHSIFEERPYWFILSATFRLSSGDPETIRSRMEELMGKRKEKQPLEYPSAGSTFKRPTGYFAAALIDQCGLKGRTVGKAAVSEKHAGFCINLGGATCRDMVGLMREVRETVLRDTGVTLEAEVRLIGDLSPEEQF